MEKVFERMPERGSGHGLYANQLLTVQDLVLFKKQLLEELLTALKESK